MDNIILTQIPLNDLLSQVKQAVREEIAAGSIQQDFSSIAPSSPVNSKRLAAYLEVTEQTIANYRKKGKIPYIQIGTAVRYDINSVIKALERK